MLYNIIARGMNMAKKSLKLSKNAIMLMCSIILITLVGERFTGTHA